MKKLITKFYRRTRLSRQIQISYFILLVPVILMLISAFYRLWDVNRKYETMINSAAAASQFSQDFKQDFDYETYLLIVGGKTEEESQLDDLLQNANEVVDSLTTLTGSEKSEKLLVYIKKYLANLESYTDTIKENIESGDHYEENMLMWETDVQVVTELIQESISEYIQNETSLLQQYQQEYQVVFYKTLERSMVLSVLSLVLILLLSYLIPKGITRPLSELSEVANRVAAGDLTARANVNEGPEITALGTSMNEMIEKINDLLEQVTLEQKNLRKAEFDLLQAQINPHFLYNTLDAIVWLAESGDNKAVVSMTGSLSEFFRASLGKGKDRVSVREDLVHARSYLEIQHTRYLDILQYEIRVPEEVMEAVVPKITLQPIVENAIYHGIKNKRGGGTITIGGYRDGDVAVLTVEDDGIGMSPDRLEQVRDVIKYGRPGHENIYGVYNVNERIRLNCGEEYGITVESEEGKGTCVSIRVPMGGDQ